MTTPNQSPATPDDAITDAIAWLEELANDGDCADWVIEKHREIAAALRAIKSNGK